MTIELKIKIKDCERRLERDFLIYEPVTLVEHDPIIMQCVNETLKEFNGEPEDISIRATMVLK